MYKDITTPHSKVNISHILRAQMLFHCINKPIKMQTPPNWRPMFLDLGGNIVFLLYIKYTERQSCLPINSQMTFRFHEKIGSIFNVKAIVKRNGGQNNNYIIWIHSFSSYNKTLSPFIYLFLLITLIALTLGQTHTKL